MQDEFDSALEKPKLVIFFNDGGPSDAYGAPQIPQYCQLVANKNHEMVFLQQVACSDKPSDVAHMNGLDKNVPGVDCTGIYEDELAECQKNPDLVFEFPDYIAKILVGALLSHYDRQDE